MQTRTLLLALIVSLTCDSSFARRLRFHKPIDAHDVHRGIQRNDSYFVRYLGAKSSKGNSSDSLDSSEESSSKSSKSSGSKSAKSSYSNGKSSKSSQYSGQSDGDASAGKSGKASYDVSLDLLNEQMPISEDSNDYETQSVANGPHSNDVALVFATDEDSSLNEHAEFFPILFDPLDPEVMMSASSNPTKRPTPSPSNMPSPLPTMRPSNNPTASPLPCGMSAMERSEQIIDVLGVDSSDPVSPQSLALDWITNKDGLFLCPNNSVELIQRYVAAVLYYSIGGGAWNQCNAPSDLNDPAAVDKANDECNVRANTFPDLTGGSNAWLTPLSECEWGGLACFPDGSIGEVSFENNGFVGTIPSELKEWTQLRRLALQQGGLYSTIPTELSLLSNLLVLDLDYNDLTGTLSGDLFGNWKVLKELDLNNNMLEGTIPNQIGGLTDLRFLQLDSNSLTGTIPSQLGQLDMLIFMSAADLQLNGIMPSQVCVNRGEPNNPDNGNLAVLIVDCDPADQKVFCECCTDCGVQEQSAIVSQLAPFWIAQQRDELGKN